MIFLGGTRRLLGQQAYDYARAMGLCVNSYGHFIHDLVEQADGTFVEQRVWVEPAWDLPDPEAQELLCEDPDLIWIDIPQGAEA